MQRPPHTTRRGFLAGLAATVAAGAGCASLGPPVPFAGRPAGDARPRDLRIEAVEGRTQGLLMRLHSATAPASGHRLLLQRSIDGDTSQTIRRIDLREPLADRLADRGLAVLDRALAELPPGSTIRYRLALRDPEAESGPSRGSDVLAINWPETPPMPEDVWSHVDVPQAVELRWKPLDRDALVFKRDVLTEGTEPERVATIRADSRGVYLDRDVERGGVYAYQVAIGADMGSTHRWGPASEALYVAVE